MFKTRICLWHHGDSTIVQPQPHDLLSKTSGTLWIHQWALTNELCSLATGYWIIFIPYLGAISKVFRPWGSVSNADHGGSRISQRSEWLYHSKLIGPIWGSLPCQIVFFNKLFPGEIKFSQRRTGPVKFLWWQIVLMQESTNQWKNLAIF